MDLNVSSISDLDMAILESILSWTRRARKFKARKFGETSDRTMRKHQHRVWKKAVDYLVERLPPLLKHPTHHIQPLSRPNQTFSTAF
jgi:hypothetical protein